MKVLIRTRSFFSTLNRYDKPVSKSEIIEIDEEDNCAIITRNLVEDFSILKDIILFNQNRSINSKNKNAFTNVIILYDFIVTILTDQKIFSHKTYMEKIINYLHIGDADEKIIKNKQSSY